MDQMSACISRGLPDPQGTRNRALRPQFACQCEVTVLSLLVKSDDAKASHRHSPSDESPLGAGLGLAGDMSNGLECFDLTPTLYEEPAEPSWAPAGPGWFDSSWQLRRGLEVREIESLDLLESVFRD